MRFITPKRTKITTINVLLRFFCTFAPIFTSNSVVFVDKGAQEYSLLQGAGYPNYATGSKRKNVLIKGRKQMNNFREK